MDERRQFVRLDTSLEVSYTELPMGAAKQTVSKNIGGGGICLFTEKPFRSGMQLQVAMKLPGREQPVNFTGEVMWSETYDVIGKGGRQRSIEVGLRFLEIAPQDQEAMMQHVILTLQPRRPSTV